VWVLNNEKIKIDQDEDFVETYTARKYAADPIKNIEDINRILDYFLSHKQYRNLLLFSMGINFGLRCGDLLQLKFGHVLNNEPVRC
jgi:integrase